MYFTEVIKSLMDSNAIFNVWDKTKSYESIERYEITLFNNNSKPLATFSFIVEGFSDRVLMLNQI